MPEVPADNSLTQQRQSAAFATRLGRIGAAALATQPAPDARPALALVRPGAEAGLSFPADAQTRKVDSSGRIKFVMDRQLSEMVGFVPGGLDAVMVDGWLVVTQPAEMIATPRDRCGPAARFTSDTKGAERILLRPAQLDCLRLGPDRQLLVAVIETARAVVLVNPAVCLAVAPGHVTALLQP